MIDRSSKGMGENRHSRKRKRGKGFRCKNYENAIGVFIRFSYDDNYEGVKKRERDREDCVRFGAVPLSSSICSTKCQSETTTRSAWESRLALEP
ncbi:hypothetical protein AAC387_Pa10g1580 [Persea americana]